MPMAAVAVRAPSSQSCIKQYYKAKIESAELLINQKTQNLRRLEAQRNALNARGNACFRRTHELFILSLYYSAAFERRAPAATGARQLCWRSREGDG